LCVCVTIEQKAQLIYSLRSVVVGVSPVLREGFRVGVHSIKQPALEPRALSANLQSPLSLPLPRNMKSAAASTKSPKTKYACSKCSYTSTHRDIVLRHINSGICVQKSCAVCQSFQNSQEYYKHLKNCASHARPTVICNARQYGKLLRISCQGDEKVSSKYECLICGKAYTSSRYLNLHKAKQMCKIYSCKVCHKPAMSKLFKESHEKQCIDKSRRDNQLSRERFEAKIGNLNQTSEEFTLIESHFNNNLKSYYLANVGHALTLADFLEQNIEQLYLKIENHKKMWSSIKIHISVDCLYEHPKTGEEAERTFSHKSVPIYPESDIVEHLESIIESILTQSDEHEKKKKGSSWSFVSVCGMVLSSAKFAPLSVGQPFKPVPDWLKKTGAVDSREIVTHQKCFYHAVVLNSTTDPQICLEIKRILL